MITTIHTKGAQFHIVGIGRKLDLTVSNVKKFLRLNSISDRHRRSSSVCVTVDFHKSRKGNLETETKTQGLGIG